MEDLVDVYAAPFWAPEGWTAARRCLVSCLLRRYEAESPLLDIGCGSGYQWPGYEVRGVDADSCAVARARGKGLKVIKAAADALPFAAGEFRTVLLLDVLEHMEDDLQALQEAHRVLAEGGLAIISVPLYQSLWSTHDERVGHLRRYRPGRVDSLLNRAGFNVLYRTRWNLPGLPGAFLRKMGLDINSAVDRFGPLMKLEARLAARFPLPLGLSGFWVGGKP